MKEEDFVMEVPEWVMVKMMMAVAAVDAYVIVVSFEK